MTQRVVFDIRQSITTPGRPAIPVNMRTRCCRSSRNKFVSTRPIKRQAHNASGPVGPPTHNVPPIHDTVNLSSSGNAYCTTHSKRGGNRRVSSPSIAIAASVVPVRCTNTGSLETTASVPGVVAGSSTSSTVVVHPFFSSANDNTGVDAAINVESAAPITKPEPDR